MVETRDIFYGIYAGTIVWIIYFVWHYYSRGNHGKPRRAANNPFHRQGT
jgi:hypothetical protein